MRGDFGVTQFGTVVAFKINRLHRDKIDNAFELVFQSDRDFHHVRVKAEFFPQLHADFKRVRARAVAFVDKGDSRNMVAF